VADLDADRAWSTSHLRRTTALLHAVIADNQTIADLFPSRAPAARRRVMQAYGELKRAERELARLQRA
jgi:hypothetical protein